jgi:dynein heavy chain
MAEPRFKWIQKTVQALLPVDNDKWQQLLDQEEGRARENLTKFLNTGALNSTVFFYLQSVSDYAGGQDDTAAGRRVSKSRAGGAEGSGAGDSAGDEGAGLVEGEEPAAEAPEAEAEDASEAPEGAAAADGEGLPPAPEGAERRKMPVRSETVALVREVLCMSVSGAGEGTLDRDCVYFMKTSAGAVPSDSNISSSLSFGCVAGTFLKDLEIMMNQVYIPALTQGKNKAVGAAGRASRFEKAPEGDEDGLEEELAEEGKSEEGAAGEDEERKSSKEQEESVSGENTGTGDAAAGGTAGAPHEELRAISLPSHIQEEILASTQKFTGHVHQTVQQVYENANIKIPSYDLEDVEAVLKDEQIIKNLEQAVDDWIKIIDKVLREENARLRENGSPMAEIDFWRDRSSKVSTVYEQLQLPGVRRVLVVLEKCDPPSPILQLYQEPMQELTNRHNMSKDNVKFLTTLERHFKNLANGSMQTIVETLPSLMHAIRMVWIISRYFNTDEDMEKLMERIANQIAGKVTEQIDIDQIFTMEPTKAMVVIKDAQKALETWKQVYETQRDKIEESATDKRWEFDRNKLFKKTKHMTRICLDLYEIVQVLDQFYKFLGPELKEVTGDSQGIDDLLREVEALKTDFRNMKSVFEETDALHWDSLVQKFKERVEQIENKAVEFLNHSFGKLKSAEAAFKLLQNFKNIESRAKIKEKMDEKFTNILTTYGDEVRRFHEIFLKHKECPPISKSTPPTAGAILWARSIFHRAKRPVLSFKTEPKLLQEPAGQSACKEYVDLGKEILEYEQVHFDAWQTTAVDVAVNYLKQHILVYDQKKKTYQVNFARELKLLIREAKYLDQLGGFELPSTVLNVALQQEKYKGYVEQLDLLIDAYNAAVGDLTPVLHQLLHKQIVEVDKCLSPGLTPLNWNSLRITDFINDCNKGMTKFRSDREQVEKNEQQIKAVVDLIEKAVLVRPFDWKRTEVMDHQEFYEFFEKHRLAQVEELVKKYETLEGFLTQIEQITAGTKKGRAPTMVVYYQYWERRIFNAITTMLIRGMSTFQTLFSANERRQPLFRVKADCIGPEIDDNGLHSVLKLINKLLKNTVHSANYFVRWMDGTCQPVPPQPGQDEDQQQRYTFYRDVKDNPALMDMTISTRTLRRSSSS